MKKQNHCLGIPLNFRLIKYFFLIYFYTNYCKGNKTEKKILLEVETFLGNCNDAFRKTQDELPLTTYDNATCIFRAF